MASSNDVKPFDLLTAGSSFLEHSELFDRLVKQCADQFDHIIADYIQQEVQISATSALDKIKITGQSDNHHFRNWVRFNDNSTEFAAISIDRALIQTILTLSCGAPAAVASDLQTNRTSVIEQSLFLQLAEWLLEKVSDVISPVTPFNLKLITDLREQSRADQKMHLESDTVCSDRFTVTIGEVTGLITINYPMSHIKSAFSQSYSRYSAAEKKQRLTKAMMKVPVKVNAAIKLSEITLSQLLSLQENDVIELDEDMTAELTCGSKILSHADVMVYDENLALKLKQL